MDVRAVEPTIGRLVEVGGSVYRISFTHYADGRPGLAGNRLIPGERRFSRGTSNIKPGFIVLDWVSDPHALSRDNYHPNSKHRVARVRQAPAS